MRRALTILASTLAVTFGVSVVAQPAQARLITIGYCADSLRGYTGQAGDNDIRRTWDMLQSPPYNYNVTASYDNPYGWHQQDNVTWNVDWRFATTSPEPYNIILASYKCYWGSDGIYHDTQY